MINVFYMRTDNRLPQGWKYKKMPEVVKWGSGGTPKATESLYYENGTIPWLIIGDLNDGIVKDSATRITKLGLKNSSAKLIPCGTLLIAMYGSIGKLGITGFECCTNQAIAFAQNLNGVDTMFLFYYLMMIKPKLVQMGKGGTQKNISLTVLNSLYIPLPPLPTQQAIVSRIETLFAELDKGVEHLRTAQQQIKTYRQAVLRDAFEKCEKEGKQLFGDLMADIRNGYGAKPTDCGNYKLLRISSVRAMNLNLSDFRLNNSSFDEKDIIQENDLLFTRYNGSVDLVGVCTYVPELNDTYAYPDKIIRCRPKVCNTFHSKFLQYYINQGKAREFVRSKIKTTSGQNGISGSDIKKIEIPLPPLSEQQRIVAEIESRLSQAEAVDESIGKALQQAEALRQSILKKAFNGELI